MRSWGQEQGETDRQEGGEENAVGQARNDQIPSELYLHLIFLHLLVLFSPFVCVYVCVCVCVCVCVFLSLR